MNDTVAEAPSTSSFQFSIGDAVAAIVSLAFPVAFATHLDREWITDAERNSLWMLVLVTLAIGFLIAIAFRRVWNSRSPLFIPPFLFCIWSWLLLFYAWDIPAEARLAMLVYPNVCIFVAAIAYGIRTHPNSEYAVGLPLFAMSLILTAVFSHTATRDLTAKFERFAASNTKQIAEAQETYHRKDHDKDGKLEYSPNLRDLYETKPGAADLKLIPLGLYQADITGPSPKPYRGYYYRILLGQGDKTPGGAKTWMDDKGNLTLAHGAVAYPSEYGETGLHSFVISSTGTIYQKDYGPDMPKIAKDMVFNPDPSDWGCCE